MASHLSSTSSAFLALPVEIRRQIYGLCIPQRLRYDVGSTLCYRNCPDWLNEIPDYSRQGLERDDATSTDNDGGDKSQRELSTDTKGKQAKRHSTSKGKHLKRPSAFVDDHRNALPALLLCCHQVTEEVTDMLYAENTFQITLNDNDEFIFTELLSPKTRQKIRKMVLILQPRGASYRPRFHMDPDIWDSILGNLQVLAVVAEQPDPSYQEIFEMATPEEVFSKWIAWITPIFECLHQTLNRYAKIVVDANDEERTIELIKEAMPGRCHFQHLPIADFIFGRGEFASKSVIWGGDWREFQLEGDANTTQDCIDDDDVLENSD
ncbi:hypothetical protein HDV64DRAFT_276318 [Trichoderma sp. TUCIM 5745]